MIGREAERAALAAACAAVAGGHGTCVLVTGEAGIGKTRLVSDALAGAGLPLYTGAARLAVPEPYAPIAQILRHCFRRVPELEEACGPLTPYLAPLLPEIEPAAQDAGEATLVEALLCAFRALSARGPAAVVLDDLQWADEATLLFLPRLAAALNDAPLLLVAVSRDEIPADTHRLRSLRAQVRRGCEPVELPLRPFERADTAQLAAAVAHEDLDDELVAALHERAHGIPFYVEELAATLALDGRHAGGEGSLPLPDSVLDAVLLRTEALSLGARNALELAAVVGERCDVVRTPGLAPDEPLAEAVAAGFVVERSPGQLAFRHALVRDAVYHGIPWTRRRSLHALVARSLEDSGASAAERAAHWLGAGDVVRARAALAEAAAASAGVYAYLDASKLYEQALDLGGGEEAERFVLLERLAVCAELAGDLAGSARAWREVIDGRRSRGEVEQLAEAEHAIGRVLALRGSTERALTAWSAAADAFAACGRPDDAAHSRLAAAAVLQSSGNFRAALVAIDAVFALLSPARRPSSARALSRSKAWCAPSWATRRARSSRCAHRSRKPSSPATRARPPPPTRRLRSSTRTPASSARRPRPTTSRSTTASRRASRRLRPSARPASATCSGRGASGGAAWRSRAPCSTTRPWTSGAVRSRRRS